MMIHQLVPFLSSMAIGLLIGLERERSHSTEAHQAAGSRTFALLALSGTLAASVSTWVIAAGLAAAAALLVIGYLTTARRDPGATTEVAALVTFLLGALAWTETGLAAALGIAVLVLLMSKRRIHSFAKDIVTDNDVEDAVRFLVMAFVVLPLLPNRDVGPYGAFNPERIWQLVLALTGISWAGYIATRVLGPKRGPLIAGLAGGFVSASSTTASMGRLSRSDDRLRPAVAGAFLASIATFVQLAGIISVADRTLVAHLWPALLTGTLLLAAIAAAIGLRSGNTAGDAAVPNDEPAPSADAPAPPLQEPRPFGLKPALVLAGVLTVALLVGRWVVDAAGARATVLASGAVGLADAHAGALTAATLHRQGQISTAIAVVGVAVALCANTAVKCGLAFISGGPRFGWRVTAGLVPASLGFLAAAAMVASTSPA